MNYKNIILINLTRMGDILQTSALMAGFKEHHPESRITLLANSAFSEICKGIQFVDELIVFNLREFRDRLLDEENSPVSNYRLLENLLTRINVNEYDLAINLTHSPASALITSLVRANEVRGFTVDSEGHRMIKHPWMRYFFNVVPNRDFNPYHIVDMYLKIGDVIPSEKGLFFDVSKEAQLSVKRLMDSMGVLENDKLVGLQLGASKADRRWPIAYFSELASLINDTLKAKIILFGSSAETALAEEFGKLSQLETINLTGKTNLGELAAALMRCSLLVSNDTGTLHLATAVNTKTIGLFSVNAHFMETGPYGEGHYVLEADLPCLPCEFNVTCKDMQCKYLIKPEAVFEVVKEATGYMPANYDVSDPLWDGLKVLKSHFMEDGYLGYYPLLKRSVSKSILYRIVYRHVWNMEHDISIDDIHKAVVEIHGEIQEYYDCGDIDELFYLLGVDIKNIHELLEYAGEGARKMLLIDREAQKESPDSRKIKDIWGSIEEIDQAIEVKGYTIPALRPVIIIFKYSKEAMEGESLQALVEVYNRIYKTLGVTLNTLQDILKGVMSGFKSSSDHKEYEVAQCK